MRMDRFTIKAQEALQQAQSRAEQNQNQEVEPEHLLIALAEQQDGIVQPMVKKIGANLSLLQSRLQDRIQTFPRVSGAAGAGAYISPRLKTVLDKAEKEAEKLKDEFISVEHLLLSMIEAKDLEVGRILKSLGIQKDAILKALQDLRGNQRITDQNPEDKYQVLEKYTKDLTALSRKGKLDPVIGRDEEIRRVMQVLSRRTKNNPVLIGEPGVGKTAIVEGLAQRIISRDVPEEFERPQSCCSGHGSIDCRNKISGRV